MIFSGYTKTWIALCFIKAFLVKDQLYSTLTGKSIIYKDNEHVKVLKVLEIKNVKHYLNFYLAFDFMFLADVFKWFWNTCLGYYKLDSIHYLSSPALSWDAMFKITGQFTVNHADTSILNI